MVLTGGCSQLLPENVCSHNTAHEQTKPCERPFNVPVVLTMLYTSSQHLIWTNKREFEQSTELYPKTYLHHHCLPVLHRDSEPWEWTHPKESNAFSLQAWGGVREDKKYSWAGWKSMTSFFDGKFSGVAKGSSLLVWTAMGLVHKRTHFAFHSSVLSLTCTSGF